MKNFLIHLILLVITVPTATSQLDSIKNLPIDSLMNWIKYEHITTNPNVPEVAYHALSRAKADKNDSLIAAIHGRISYWNYVNYEVNNIDTIIYHTEKQIEHDSIAGNLSKMARGYMDLGNEYVNNGQVEKGQDLLLRAMNVYKSLDSDQGIAEVQYQLAYVYLSLKQPEKAISLVQTCLKYFEKVNDHFSIASTYTTIMPSAYMELEDLSKAQEYIDKAIAYCEENDFVRKEYFLVNSYYTKGYIHFLRKEYSVAEEYYRRTWNMEKQFNGPIQAERYRYDIGQVLLIQDKPEEAIEHLLVGVLATEKFRGIKSSYYVNVADCYEKLENYKEAAIYRKKAFEFEQESSQDIIASLEAESIAKYELGRKDQELSEQAQIIGQKNSIQKLIIGVVALLSALLFSLLYFFNKNKKTNSLLQIKNSEIEERNHQNETLLKEIHHRVKNNLQVISSLLNFQSRSIDDQMIKTALLDSQSRVRSMSLIHQKLYRGPHLASVEMKNYLRDLAESLIDAYSDEDVIDVQIDMDLIELDVDVAIPVGLIANELMTNSLKYAFPKNRKGAIKIELEQSDQDLILKISDNGIGSLSQMPSDEEGGFGSELVKMLSYQIKGEMSQNSDNGFNTEIKFPYSKVA